MNAQVLKPHPLLCPYIKYYMYFEAGKTGEWNRVDTSPTALPVMAFVLETDRFFIREVGSRESLTLTGQLTKFSRYHFYGSHKAFYVFFHPAGPYQLLGVPLKEVKDQVILNFTDLNGASARRLKEKLSEQTTIMGLKNTVETFFIRRLSNNNIYEKSVRLAYTINQIGLYSHQNNSIKRLCDDHYYSISTLERHMREIVGIGPKLFQRIIRFNKVLSFLNQVNLPYNWSQIAVQFGYFDQTHFIKEFAWFYGITPGNLIKLNSKLQLSLNLTGEEASGKSLFRVYK